VSITVGDRLAGRPVSAIIDSVPLSFERRRCGSAHGGTTFTWVYAHLGDRWVSLGDPWPVLRPKSSDILAAVDRHLVAIKAVKPDKSRILITLHDARTGIEHFREVGSTTEFNQGSTTYRERWLQDWISDHGNQQHATELTLIRWEYLSPAQWKNFYDCRPAGSPPPAPSSAANPAP